MKGAPDWANVRKGVSVFRLDDMAELAARLGSIVTFDRRGDVVWLDDFEYGLAPWQYAVEPANGTLTIVAANTMQKGYAAQILTPDLVGSAASLSKTLWRLADSKHGWETSFTLHANLSKISLVFFYYDGTNVLTYEVDYDHVNNRLQVWDAVAGFTTFASDLNLRVGTGLYHFAKLVVDGENEIYQRFLLDGQSYLLSAYSPVSSASPVNPSITPQILVLGVAPAQATINVGHGIITQNEP